MKSMNAFHPDRLPAIVIPAGDYDRLVMLARTTAQRTPELFEYLNRELARADVVADGDCGQHIVRIGSCVEYRDERSGATQQVTLVWPHAASTELQRVSVLTPVGAALLGLCAGQSIDWLSPVGETRRLTVLSVAPAASPRN